LSNIYEFIQQVLIILLGVILTGLFNNVGAQTNFLLFISILQIITYSFIKPHILKWDYF